jgi:hypothetical protein
LRSVNRYFQLAKSIPNIPAEGKTQSRPAILIVKSEHPYHAPLEGSAFEWQQEGLLNIRIFANTERRLQALEKLQITVTSLPAGVRKTLETRDSRLQEGQEWVRKDFFNGLQE